MKLRNLKLLDKFVFRNEPGVYKKVRNNRAKCVFGPDGAVGTECDIDPDADVFVVDERKQQQAPSNGHTVRVVFCDSDENVIKELGAVPLDKANLYAQMEAVKMRLPRKRKPSLLNVTAVGLDADEGILAIEVRVEDITE